VTHVVDVNRSGVSWPAWASAPWLWLAVTYLVLAIGTLILYGGAHYPGLFDDSDGLDLGRDRELAMTAWRARYFHVGLPLAVVAAATTVGWLLALRRTWLLVLVAGTATFIALTAQIRTAWIVLWVLLLPVVVVLFVPWQLVVAALAGVAVVVLRTKPTWLWLHGVALLAALSWQVIFTCMSLMMSIGTLG
jgi:hypothetical protein